MTLPTGFGYATIHGKYISAVLDTTDADREPDVVPLSGLTITLTPSAGGSLLKSLADPPMTIVLMPIVARTDATGVIVGPDGQPGIVIVASDYPDPAHPWTYSVSVVGNGIPKMSFNIVALSGESIDLTSVLEVSSSGSDLSAWAALATQVHEDAALAEAAASAANGPTGGETGQVLAKASPADYDTEWIDPPTGTGGGAVDSVAGRTGVVTLTADDLTDATTLGKALARAADAAAARTAIGAGTSNLAIGITSSTAKAGDYQPSTANISDASATGKSLVTAADPAAARAVIGAGTSDLAIGTTSTTAKAGNYQPTAANISDATATGRSVLTASSATTARAAIGAGTSSVVIGTTAGTAADAAATTAALNAKEPSIAPGQAGQYFDGTKTWQPFPTGGAVTADSITDATATGKSVIRATDAATARAAIGAGTSNLAVGTTSGTAKAGDYQPTAANISDATATGRSVVTATDAAAARSAIGAGVSNLAIGTTSTTAKAGDYQPAAANISDATATGRSVLTAASATAARTAIGAGTSNVAIGTTAGTAADAGALVTSLAGKEPTIAAGTTAQYRRGDKSWQTLDKAAVGLSNVQNLAVYVLAVGAPDPTGASPAGLYVKQTS